jgi:hypothetical protein
MNIGINGDVGPLFSISSPSRVLLTAGISGSIFLSLPITIYFWKKNRCATREHNLHGSDKATRESVGKVRYPQFPSGSSLEQSNMGYLTLKLNVCLILLISLTVSRGNHHDILIRTIGRSLEILSAIDPSIHSSFLMFAFSKHGGLLLESHPYLFPCDSF